MQLKKNNLVLGISLLWLLFQGFVAYRGFYLPTYQLPPRFIFLVLPLILLIVCLFSFKTGRTWLNGVNTRILTYLHIIRIPVELVLWLFYLEGKVPVIMTFEGANFDIVSGITAFFIAYFGYRSKKISPYVLLAWNGICLLLLLTIVYLAVFSAPTPFQKYGFEQANVAVFYFPYVYLPGFIVPLVLFSHLVCIRKLYFHLRDKRHDY